MRKMVILSIIFLFFLSLGVISAADPENQDVYVAVNGSDANTGASDSPYAKIGKAVNVSDANNNVNIHLGEGNFAGTGNVNLTINKNHSSGGSLTFIGAGINKTFINGGKTSWLMNIGANSKVTLINITFINGKGSNGGAITTGTTNAILNIYNCSFEGNNATTSGGAIYLGSTTGSLTVSNSVFNNNSATSNGGAIYSSSITNITDSVFENSSSGGSGGVVYISGASTRYSFIKDSTFVNSTATNQGGSLYTTYASIVNNTFENSKTTSTTSSYGGGAIYGGNLYLENNIMTSCSAGSGNGNYIKVSSGLINNSFVTINSNSVTSPFVVTANVVDDVGHPIDGGSITFYANSTSLGSGSVVNGLATLNTITLVDNGVYILSGTSSNFNNITNGTLNVNINRSPSTYYVGANGSDTTGDGSIDHPYATIQKAIDNGTLNLTLNILPGTLRGVGNVNVTLSDYMNVTIVGTRNQSSINGDGVNWLFKISNTSNVNLINLTFINGKTTNGGAIYNQGILNIYNCSFENNNATTSGGAIYSSGSTGSLNVSNSYFNNNYAATNGGAIYSTSVSNISDSSFVNSRSGTSGGAIYMAGSASNLSSITNSVFTNSTSVQYGGSLYTTYTSIVNNTFEDSKTTGTTSSYGGGAIYGGNIYLENNIMTSCSADSGNGNYIKVNGPVNNSFLTINNLTVTGLNFTVTANVVDDMGHPIDGGSVTFYVNSTSLGSGSVVNGLATLNTSKLLDNGVYILSGTSSNFSNITNGTLNVNITLSPLTYYVGQNGSDTTGDGSIDHPYATIQKAIDTGFTNPGIAYVNIYLLPGTYSGTGNVRLDLTNSTKYIGTLNIMGLNGQAIINGNGADWVFSFGSNYLNANLANLTITNAKGNNVTSASGTPNAGIIRIGGSVIIDNCIFENNNGVSVSLENNGKLIINNSIFRANYGSNYGTSVLASYATATLKIYDTIFENNTAAIGGVAVLLNGLNNTIISGCTFKDLVITNNLSFSSGGHGAILWRGSIAGKFISISNSYFTNNTLDLHHTWDTGQAAVRPTIELINCTFNSSGGITGGAGNMAYYEALWKVINSSFINMQCDGIFRTENPAGNGLNTVDFYYLSFIGSPGSIIQGSLFENTTGVIFGGSFNITDSVILNQVTLMKAWTNAAVTMNLNNNYWGFNNPNDCFVKIEQYGNNQYKVNTILDYWIMPKLVADGKAGLSQVVSLVYTAFDGVNYHDYDVSSIPIPEGGFTYVVVNGTGNLTTNGYDAVYTVSSYGVNTIVANFTDGNYVSLDVNFHTDATNTTVSLSKPGGENGEYVDVTVDVTGEDGSPVNEGSVEFFLNGNSLGTVKVVNGKATKRIQVNGLNGPYEIYANYSGTEIYGESSGAEIYQLLTVNPTVSINRPGGSYNSVQNIILISDDPTAVIYYTLDGSNPTTSSSVYSGPILLSSSKTLKYFAVDPAGNRSQIYTQSYVIDTVAPSVSVNRAGGTFNSALNVTLTSADPTAIIYYTTNGSNPTTSSSVYSGPILLSSSKTLKYFAVDPAGNRSQIYTQSYKIDAVAPKVSKVDPAKNAVVKAGKAIKVTFNEAIKFGSKAITLKNSSGKAVAFTRALSSDKKVLTVTAKSVWGSGKYTLALQAGSVADLAGNLLKAYSSSFTVDTVVPKVSKVDPVNSAVKVAAGKTIKVTFNEAIKKGSKKVELKNSSNKAVAFTSSISGKVLTIKPKKKLAESKYRLILNTGSIIDKVGNSLKAKTISFTVGTPPKVSKIDPRNGATRVARSKTIKVTFNEAIKKGSKYRIELRTSIGNKLVKIGKSISGKVLSIKHARLVANTKYKLVIYTGSITDKAGNPVAAKTYTFTTGRT